MNAICNNYVISSPTNVSKFQTSYQCPIFKGGLRGCLTMTKILISIRSLATHRQYIFQNGCGTTFLLGRVNYYCLYILYV